MKQREVRGAASPGWKQEQKEEDRRTEWGRTVEGEGNDERAHLVRKTNTLLLNEQPMANERTMVDYAPNEKTRVTFSARRFTIILISAPGQR